MLHACAARFDVMGNLEKFCELNKAEASASRLERSVDLSGQKMCQNDSLPSAMRAV